MTSSLNVHDLADHLLVAISVLRDETRSLNGDSSKAWVAFDSVVVRKDGVRIAEGHDWETGGNAVAQHVAQWDPETILGLCDLWKNQVSRLKDRAVTHCLVPASETNVMSGGWANGCGECRTAGVCSEYKMVERELRELATQPVLSSRAAF